MRCQIGNFFLGEGAIVDAILYDAFTGAILRRFENNNNDIDDVKFILGGKYLVITTEDYSKVYDISTGDEKSKTKPAIFSEEGNYLKITKSILTLIGLAIIMAICFMIFTILT